jgi:hypothetical protein
MKTKEIDVWVQDTLVSDAYDYSGYIHRKPKDGYLKAKLIIEIPEKKITITESEFEEVWSRYISCHQGFSDINYMISFKKELGF